MSVAVHADPDLAQLVALFHRRFEDLGLFSPVLAEEMLLPYRELLAHEHHMTVTVENHHRSAVDVEVLAARRGRALLAQHLLRRKTDRAVVQYGIVRLDLERIGDEVRRDILSQKIPLGRVLIQHNVLRTVHLSRLWRVACGPTMAAWFACPPGTETYGRTAAILTSGTPAIELLEVVSPES